MAELDKRYVIHSEGDGVLGNTDLNDVRNLVQEASASDHIVIHLHGGLVDYSDGLKIANRLTQDYIDSGVYPVFFVWETGGFETVLNNLEQIVQEDVFGVVFGKVLKWLGFKATVADGRDSMAGLHYPDEATIDAAIAYIKGEREEDIWAPEFDTVSDLTDAESRAFEQDLASDQLLRTALAEISGRAAEDKSDGVLPSQRAVGATLLSPEVIALISEDDHNRELDGIRTWAGFTRLALKVLHRVIRRFRKGRGHGAYTTVIEEILHAFYLVNVPAIGEVVWRSMKSDARETFEPDTQANPRAGRTFWTLLAEKISQNPGLKVSVVAHSAGAIFASHMIEHIRTLKSQARLPADFAFSNLIFLAPAVRTDMFSEIIENYPDEISNIRMFALTDKAERGYWEFPGYKGSLLYMVSGLFEKGDKYHDVALTGMARYIENEQTYTSPMYQIVRDYLAKDQRTVWSPNTSSTPGLQADSEKHGDFDQNCKDQLTMQSVTYILSST